MVRVVAIPSVALSCVAHHDLTDILIVAKVAPRVLSANLTWSLDARLGLVSHGTAVGASSLTELGYLVAGEATLCRVVDALLVGCGSTLMLEGFHVSCLLLLAIGHVPGGFLDILGHVGQVDLWLLLHFNT